MIIMHFVFRSVVPELKRLFSPFLNQIKQTLEPGFSQINWYCLDWKAGINILPQNGIIMDKN